MKRLSSFLTLLLVSVLLLSSVVSAFSFDLDVNVKTDEGNQTNNETEETNDTDDEGPKKPPVIDIADKMTDLAKRIADWFIGSVLPKLTKSN